MKRGVGRSAPWSYVFGAVLRRGRWGGPHRHHLPRVAAARFTQSWPEPPRDCPSAELSSAEVRPGLHCKRPAGGRRVDIERNIAQSRRDPPGSVRASSFQAGVPTPTCESRRMARPLEAHGAASVPSVSFGFEDSSRTHACQRHQEPSAAEIVASDSPRSVWCRLGTGWLCGGTVVTCATGHVRVRPHRA